MSLCLVVNGSVVQPQSVNVSLHVSWVGGPHLTIG